VTSLSPSELRDATANRGAQVVGHFVTQMTDPDAWIEALKLDADDITDNDVWLADSSGEATIAEGEGHYVTGGDRKSERYQRKYFEASYLCRGQIRKLSHFCGVVWFDGPAQGAALERSTATGAKLTGVRNKVETALSPYTGLRKRYGGSLAYHNVEQGWQAHPGQAIEVPQEMTCATCAEVIYHSNNAWRHKGSGRAEVNISRPGRDGRTAVLALHHLASPDEVGKQI
jgi:hypothetical protein